jgi:hypothetical protein
MKKRQYVVKNKLKDPFHGNSPKNIRELRERIAEESRKKEAKIERIKKKRAKEEEGKKQGKFNF